MSWRMCQDSYEPVPVGLYCQRLLCVQLNILVHTERLESKQITSLAAVIISLSLSSLSSLKSTNWKFPHLKSCGDPVQSECLHWGDQDPCVIKLLHMPFWKCFGDTVDNLCILTWSLTILLLAC